MCAFQALDIRSPARVPKARAALLTRDANLLLTHVRDVLCEPTRTQIVRVMTAGPLRVNDLAAVIGRSKSATSQHLRVLRKAGVVLSRRRGRAVYYGLADTPQALSAVEAIEAVVHGAAK